MIGVFNLDKSLRNELNKQGITYCKLTPGEIFDGYITNNLLSLVLIDLEPNTSRNKDRLIKQTDVLDSLKNMNIPVIIFDRCNSLEDNEVLILRTSGFEVFSPVILKKNTEFQPIWGKIHDLESATLFSEKRSYDLVLHDTNLKFCRTPFIKYYGDFILEFDLKMGMGYSVIVSNEHKEAMRSNGIGIGCALQDTKCSVILSSKKSIDIGYLGDIFQYLDNGVIPLLPIENKYYKNFLPVVKNVNEIDLFISQYEYAGFGIINDIYSKLLNQFPLFSVENFVYKLMEYI